MYGQDVVVSIADQTQMVHYCTVRRRTVNVVNTVCEKVLQLIYFFLSKVSTLPTPIPVAYFLCCNVKSHIYRLVLHNWA